jgi:hypothetical protein
VWQQYEKKIMSELSVARCDVGKQTQAQVALYKYLTHLLRLELGTAGVHWLKLIPS